MTGYLDDIRTSYDRVAPSYAVLVQEPAEGEDDVLDLIAASAVGPVLDAGCGPGRLTGRLKERGVRAVGLDLSPGMIAIARRDHSAVDFCVASITDLPFASGALGAVVSWWSLIHLPRAVVPRALAEFYRVLTPAATVVLGFHAGTGSTHKTSGYGGHAMDVHVHRWQPEELTALAMNVGLRPRMASMLPPDVLCFRKPDGD